MKTTFMKRTLRIFGYLLIAVCTSHCFAQMARPTANEETNLRNFLKRYLPDDDATKYPYAFVDLNADGKLEAIVYMTRDSWCGSGGCGLLILAPDKSTYKVITETTITRPPIRVLDTKTNGWRDLGVWVQGGGIQPGYEAKLMFNGKTYPKNPSTPPAQRLKGKVAGRVLIPASTS
jgi:hypothetical protein